MKITKYYLSGGYTFDADFEPLNNGMVKITATIDLRTDKTETVFVAEEDIKSYIGSDYYNGIEELNSNQVSRIVSKFVF